MKFLHCADIHLGSKMEAKLPKDKADERKLEVRAAFDRMIDYAVKNGISVVLLAGDVFDGDRPLKRDKDYFYGAVRSHPDIDFLYLRGNHDVLQSYTEQGLDNLKTFSDEWTVYEYGDVAVWGIESVKSNATAMYAALKPDKTKKNIVMLHGQIGDANGVHKINLAKLRNKHIDYLALGHLHTFSDGAIDERGKYVYSGCLEGRGFDELGVKGFVELDITENGAEYVFRENSQRVINEIEVDISDTDDIYAACKKAKSKIACAKKDMLRIMLVGDVGFELDGIERELEKMTARDCFFVTVKNNAVRKFDINAVKGDISLRGEYIRTVLENDGYTDEQKQRIISVGLKALGGREVE